MRIMKPMLSLLLVVMFANSNAATLQKATVVGEVNVGSGGLQMGMISECDKNYTKKTCTNEGKDLRSFGFSSSGENSLLKFKNCHSHGDICEYTLQYKQDKYGELTITKVISTKYIGNEFN